MNFVSVSNNIIIHTSIAIINGMKHILNGKHKQPFEHLHTLQVDWIFYCIN